MKTKALVFGGLTLSLLAGQALAHHSFAMFDADKMITKTGTNRFVGSYNLSAGGSGTSFANLSGKLLSDLLAAVPARALAVNPGLIPSAKTLGIYDNSASLSGPIVRDRMWFALTTSVASLRQYRVGSYNLDGTRALDENLMRNVSTKVSWQVRRANQFHVLYNFNNKGQFNRTENTGPITDFIDNAATSHQVINSSIVQAKWTSILPRKMLLDDARFFAVQDKEGRPHPLEHFCREVAYDDDFRFHPDPVLHVTIPKDGEYTLKIDQYRGPQGTSCSKNCGYQLQISRLPVVTAMFPLGARPGAAYKVRIDGEALESTTGAYLQRGDQQQAGQRLTRYRRRNRQRTARHQQRNRADLGGRIGAQQGSPDPVAEPHHRHDRVEQHQPAAQRRCEDRGECRCGPVDEIARQQQRHWRQQAAPCRHRQDRCATAFSQEKIADRPGKGREQRDSDCDDSRATFH